MLLYAPFATSTMEVTILFKIAAQLQIVLSPSLSFTVATVLRDSHCEYLVLRHPKSAAPDAIWPSNRDFHAKKMCPKLSGIVDFPAFPTEIKAFGCKYLPFFWKASFICSENR